MESEFMLEVKMVKIRTDKVNFWLNNRLQMHRNLSVGSVLTGTMSD